MIGIVGAVILIAAMVGVFQYERSRAPGLVGDNIALQSFEIANTTGTTTIGASTDEALNVTRANMTNVTFTLKWTTTPAAAGAPPPAWTLRLEVTPPAGVNATGETSAESSSGTAEVKLSLPNARPDAGPVTAGVGEWQVKVTFVSSDSPTTDLPLPQTEQARWTLAGTAQAWAPAPAPPADTP